MRSYVRWLLVAHFFWPAAGFAEVSIGECAPGYTGTRRVAMAVEGAPGIWLAAPIAQCVIRRNDELLLSLQRIALLEERLALDDARFTRLQRVIEVTVEAERRAVEALDHSDARRREAEERLVAWYRSPAFWVAVGVVMAGALVAVTAWGLNAVSK